jgi:hypothetical protein
MCMGKGCVRRENIIRGVERGNGCTVVDVDV